MTETSTPKTAPFNGWAVAGLIIGVISLLATFLGLGLIAIIGGVVAVLTGLDGISKARKNGNGLGMAIGAICCGAVPLLIVAYTFLR